MQTFIVITFWVSLLLILISCIVAGLDMGTDDLINWNDDIILAIIMLGWGLGGLGLVISIMFVTHGGCSGGYNDSGYYMPVQVGGMSVPMFVPN